MKPGTRVKVTNPEAGYSFLKNATGEVVGYYDRPIWARGAPRYDLRVRLDREFNFENRVVEDNEWNFYRWELSPLTDPKAETFIESIKKLSTAQPIREKEPA
jgi:hypothetical protein